MRFACPLGRSVNVGISATILVAALACGSDGAPAGEVAVDSQEWTSRAEADDVSIFDLDLDLIDQDGVALTLADLAGRPTLAAMVYTSCKDVCIMITEQMKAIERLVDDADADIRYALFSLDPARDSPATMRDYARAQKLDTARWRLMAASEEGVRDLAAVLGVRYQAEEDGLIAHSAMIFVIDADGVVRHRQVGVTQDADALLKAVRMARP